MTWPIHRLTSSVHDVVYPVRTLCANPIWKWYEAKQLARLSRRLFVWKVFSFLRSLAVICQHSDPCKGYTEHSYGRSLAWYAFRTGTTARHFSAFWRWSCLCSAGLRDLCLLRHHIWQCYPLKLLSHKEIRFPSILIVLRVRGVKSHSLCFGEADVESLDEHECLIYWSSLACSSGYEIAAI